MGDEPMQDGPFRWPSIPERAGTAPMSRPDAGLTLMEIMITTGIMVIGLVLLMSTMVSLANQSKVVDAATAGSLFSSSVFDAMNGKTFDALMQFNSTGDVFAANLGIVNLDGVGQMEVTIQAVIPGENEDDTPTLIELPLTQEKIDELGKLPNPIEIEVEMTVIKGTSDAGNKGYHFSASRMVYYN